MGDTQTGEQLYRRSSHAFVKILGPTTDFPTWGSDKGTEYPQGIWLWRSAGFDYKTFTGLKKQSLLKGTNKTLSAPRTQEKGAVTPQETEPDLPASVQESPAEAWVNSGLPWSQRHWLQQSWEPQHAGVSPFWRRLPLMPLPHHSLASGHITGREHSPTHQQKIGLKTYWAWPCQPEQDLVFSTANPPHHPIRKLPQAS